MMNLLRLFWNHRVQSLSDHPLLDRRVDPFADSIEETRQKISGAGNGMYGKTHSKEAKQKISESSSRRRHTQTTKEHMSLIRQGAQTQEWIVLTPEKLEIHVSNLKLFCKENNIKYHTLYSSLGKSEISRGAGKGYKLMRSPNISLAY